MGLISFDTKIKEDKKFNWKAIRFGQSVSANNTFINVKENSVEISSVNNGGKVATDHDGIAYYYTVLDKKYNFKISADIKVMRYAKNPHDGQEGFGIMARDVVGENEETAVLASNIVGVGGYSGSTKSPNGTQLFYRKGVKGRRGMGSKGTQSMMIEELKPTPDNTNPEEKYRLSLEKNNSGYRGCLNKDKEQFLYEPELLEVQSDKIYLGFFCARVARIEVENIHLTISRAAKDAPKKVPSLEPVSPDFNFLSLEKTAVKDYSLVFRANFDGTAKVKKNGKLIVDNLKVKAGKKTIINNRLKANSNNKFKVTILPDRNQNLTEAKKITKSLEVEMKTYRSDRNIYVSPEGNPEAKGSSEDPLDVDTAIAFSRPGQKIILLDGHYLRNEKLEIKRYNDGTKKRLKYLVAEAGTKPIFDFDQNSKGIILSANYWHIKGINVTRSAANENGMRIGGHHNIIENSRFYDNGGTGLQISSTDNKEARDQWPSYNLILNSTAFDNVDPSNNNADGFAAKITAGEGNLFKGCISHNNIDDGWDLYTKVGSGAIGKVVIEDCISHSNGTLTDGTVGNGDKNGFKLGGEGIDVPHLIKNSIAFANGSVGFTSNSNPGVRAVNNISFNNQDGNIDFRTFKEIEENFVIEEFISFATKKIEADSYPEVEASNHNFFYDGEKSTNIKGIKISEANFESLEIELPIKRNEDGSINKGDFLEFISPIFSK